MHTTHPNTRPREGADDLKEIGATDALSPYVREVWEALTPGERLARSWALRSRIPDIQAWHDAKLFPKP